VFGVSVGIIASSGGPSAPTAPVAGYRAWYDASDTSTITVSGSNVTQWNDKSGNALNLVQATSSKQPQSGTRTQNGKNMIDYDGTDDVLTSNAASSAWKFLTDSTGSTFFMAIYADTDSSGWQITDVSNGSVANQPSYTIYKNPNDTGFFGKGTNNPNGYSWFISNTTQTFTDNAAQYWTVVSDPTNGTAANRLKIYKNTTLDSSTNAQTGTSSTSNPALPLSLGGLQNFSGDSLDGAICEIIIYDSILSGADIDDNHDYLAAKWGI
jgi:hypothetical protein